MTSSECRGKDRKKIVDVASALKNDDNFSIIIERKVGSCDWKEVLLSLGPSLISIKLFSKKIFRTELEKCAFLTTEDEEGGC